MTRDPRVMGTVGTGGSRVATHRCSACGAKVDMDADDSERHVCVIEDGKAKATTAERAAGALEERVRALTKVV